MESRVFNSHTRLRRALILVAAFSIFSYTVAQAADTGGTKGPIGVSGKTTTGVTGPVKGTTTTKLKSDIIVINAPVKKVSGATGATGSTGAQGPMGPQGPEGQEGMVGPQGPEGLQGVQGPQGIQGPIGPQGPQGVAGVAGAKGEKGDTGPQGPAGPPGRDGVSSGGGGGGGADGAAATISIGTVQTGDTAAVTNSGTSNAAILNFVFPTGGTVTNNYSNTFKAGQGATTTTGTTSCDPGKKVSSLVVVLQEVSVTCTVDESGTGSFDTNSVDASISCLTYGVKGLEFTSPKVKPVCATTMPTAIATALSALQGVITIKSGDYSSGGCSSGTAVKKLNLVMGILTYECGSTGSSGGSDLSVNKETSSSKFSYSEQCSSGDTVKGLKYVSGTLSFLCSSVGSSSEGGNSYGHDDGESSWGDGNSKTKTTLSVAGLLGPALTSTGVSSCTLPQVVVALTVDSNGDFGVTCGTPATGSLSTSSVSTTQCSGTSGFANGLTYTNSKLTIACTSRMPYFSDGAIINGVTGGSLSYDGSNFTVTIPSGVLGSTVTLNNTSDSCASSEKVSGLTLSSSKVLAVTCATDDVTPISSVSITPLNVGASPTASYTSSSKKLTLGIPAGATGAKGDTGAAGADGNDGVTPTIAVNPTIGTGSAAVSVAQTTVNNVPKYTFTFTLPSVPTGYLEKYACFKNDGTIQILSNSGSSCSSGTKYTILLKP